MSESLSIYLTDIGCSVIGVLSSCKLRAEIFRIFKLTGLMFQNTTSALGLKSIPPGEDLSVVQTRPVVQFEGFFFFLWALFCFTLFVPSIYLVFMLVQSLCVVEVVTNSKAAAHDAVDLQCWYTVKSECKKDSPWWTGRCM